MKPIRWTFEAKWLLAAVLLTGCASGGQMAAGSAIGIHDGTVRPDDQRLDSVRTRLQQMTESGELPSVTVGVARDGVVLWAEGFGWADREARRPATPTTPYSIASITKPMTATAVMTLSERGLLDLDAPIEHYLPGMQLRPLAGASEGVTARRIMAHSAGLPTHFRVYFDPAAVPTPEETIRRYGIVVFTPGTRFEYSNIGYRLLDVTIARLSGQSYGEYLRSHVFAPLGMLRTAVLDSAWAPDVATPYDAAGDRVPHYTSDTPGSGHVWSTVGDMLLFGMSHLGTPGAEQAGVLRPETVRLMQRDASRTTTAWGLGWGLGTERGHRIVNHGGGQPGVSTWMALYPDERLVIVVLTNRSQVLVRGIAQQIASALLPPAMAATVDSSAQLQAGSVALSGFYTGTVTTHDGTEPFALNFHPDGEITARLGMERTTAVVRDVRRTADALSGTFAGGLNTKDVGPLRQQIAITLVPRNGELVGQVLALGTHDVFGHASFARLRPLDHARLEEYAGTFSHGDGDVRVIQREGDQLFSQRGTGRQYALEPLGEDLFLLRGTGGSTLRFIRADGRVTAVAWNDGAPGPRVR